MIDAAYPRSGVEVIRRFGGSNWSAAEFVARRLKELKAQGYQRIYVGGQSWGGWDTLDLATMRGLPLDGVVLIVPACCGWRPTGANTDDPNFANNKFYFDQLIQNVRYPTVGVFFLGDEYEPADRGKGAAEALTKRGVRQFDDRSPTRLFGSRLGLVSGLRLRISALHCRVPGRAADHAMSATEDCRAAAAIFAPSVDKQIVDWTKHTATLPDVTGKRFAVYPDGDERTIASPTRPRSRATAWARASLPHRFAATSTAFARASNTHNRRRPTRPA